MDTLSHMFSVDWQQLFGFDTPVLEIFLRGTIMYLALFFMMRFILRRQSGGIGITDVLVIVLLADAAQNGMAGDYHSIADGLLLVGTIMWWSYALDWASFHISWVRRIVEPPATPLVRHGQILWRNLRHEQITENELMTQLRLQGIEELSKVKLSYMEPDGRISAIPYDDKPIHPNEPRAV
jgi:uncharacterized membrane protein YcaP (DUF421 family)